MRDVAVHYGEGVGVDDELLRDVSATLPVLARGDFDLHPFVVYDRHHVEHGAVFEKCYFIVV